MTKPDTPTAFAEAVQATLTGSKATPTRKDGPSGRFYVLEDGTELPSVTHILSVIAKPALVAWSANQERAAVIEAAADLYEDTATIAQRMSRPAYVTTLQSRIGKQKAHQKELAKAGEIGTECHKLVEWNIRKGLGQEVGPEPRVTDKAQWSFMGFQDWASSVSLKPKLIEQKVWSRKYGYAGTMDLLAEVNGVPTLVDIKTSKNIYPEMFLQVAAYAMALEEMGFERPVAGLIVRLPKNETDPEFEAVPVPPFEALFPAFLAARQLWAWSYANEEAYRQRRASEKGA